MTIWNKFDINNKQFPLEAGLYLWKTDNETGLFELLIDKPVYVPYDIKYLINGKFRYIIFDDNYPPIDINGNYKLQYWNKQ